MSSPVGAHAPAGDPVFRRPRRLPGCSFGPLDVDPVARSDHRTADDRSPGCPLPRPPSVRHRRPGCPARRSRTSMPLPPTPSARLPVRRLLRPRPPVRPPRLPGSSSPAPHRLPREGSSARIKDHPPPAPLSPREPGWPFDSPRSPLRAPQVPRHRSSGSGWRALTGTKHTLHALFPQVNRVFLSTQGYPPGFPVDHRSFSFVHCSHTGCAQVNV